MKKTIPLLFALCLIISGCGDPQTQLEQAVTIISKDVPQKLDAATTMVKVEAGKMEIIYTYEINGVTDDEMKSGEADLKKNVTTQLRTNKGVLGFYIKNKIPMTYIYNNTAGELLVTFSVKPWEL